MSVTVVSRDLGLNELKKTFKSKKKVKVGFQGQAAATLKRDTDDTPTDVTVVDVATWQEFGTPRIPMRSIIRRAVVLNEAKIQDWLRKGAERVVDLKATERQTLDQIGLKIVSTMQDRVESGEITPPLADSTIEHRRKHTETPLLDTGQLRSSITSKVE